MAKRGRKVGAVSFCKITLAELNNILKPTAQVIVSVRYAEMIGLKGSLIVSDTNTVQALADSITVDVEVEQFASEPNSDGFAGVKPVIQIEDFN
jgi:hypothetical protein